MRFIYLVLLAFGFALFMVLLWLLEIVDLGIALSIGIATLTAIIGWNISNQIQIRRDIEVKKCTEFLEKITSYTDALSKLSLELEFGESEVVTKAILDAKSKDIKWSKLYIEYSQKIMTRLSSANELSLRSWVSTNEIFVVELEQFYTQVLNNEDKIFSTIRKINLDNALKFTNISTRDELKSLTQEFDSSIHKLKELQDWCDDLARISQNHFLAPIFQRKLTNRRPSTQIQKLEDAIKNEVDVKKM